MPTRRQQESGDNGQWKIGVASALVHQGQVLLVRHTYGEKEGRWALPGGYTTPKERLDESAVRELLEETGITAEVVDVIGMVTRYTDLEGAVFVVFRMRLVSGQPEPDGVEVSQTGWFSAAEVATMTDEELWSEIRNPVLAALKGQEGLLENESYPGRSERARAFLVK
jgi:ADP-ribose pyrophosphatase YjhB (NUDIX family)